MIVSPACVRDGGEAILTIASDGDWVTVTVTMLEVALTVPFEGVVPWVVAWSTIDPWLMSPWVTV